MREFLSGACFVLGSLLMLSCIPSCDQAITQVLNAPADTTAADTTWVPCPPETVWIPTPPDTVWREPDWDCFEACQREHGLAHWRICVGACLEAR